MTTNEDYYDNAAVGSLTLKTPILPPPADGSPFRGAHCIDQDNTSNEFSNNAVLRLGQGDWRALSGIRRVSVMPTWRPSACAEYPDLLKDGASAA